MSAKIGRNDPCPCGSGKKYKQCHLGAEDDPGRRELPPTTEEAALAKAVGEPLPSWTRYVPWAIGAVGALAGLGLWVAQGPKAGGAVLAATAVGVGLWFLFSDPPPPRDDAGDPAALNFGRRE